MANDFKFVFYVFYYYYYSIYVCTCETRGSNVFD